MVSELLIEDLAIFFNLFYLRAFFSLFHLFMSDIESDSEVITREQDARGSNSHTMNTQTSAQTPPQVTKTVPTSHVTNHTSIPKAYHLVGLENYGSWAFRMKNILQRDGLYDFCINTHNNPMPDPERKWRHVAMSAINNSVKGGVALKLLKRYSEPFECWTSLKSRYESDSTARQMLLIDKFFTIRKIGSMDEYLVDIKEAADQMEEVNVGLSEKVIVHHTLKNLPRDYNTIK
jgi:hypothetical protein